MAALCLEVYYRYLPLTALRGDHANGRRVAAGRFDSRRVAVELESVGGRSIEVQR